MERCNDMGPSPEHCLLEPWHAGFHKSNFRVWPNQAESLEHWADIGRWLMRGPMPGLSRKEMDYALDALRTVEERRA